jgi:hypothetical protein
VAASNHQFGRPDKHPVLEDAALEIVTKKCCDCKCEKPKDEFSYQNKAKGILRSVCRACSYIRTKKWIEANPDRVAEYRDKNRPRATQQARERRAKDPEKRRQYGREYRKRKPDLHRDEDLRLNYGITLDDFRELETKQNNQCAICGVSGETMRFKKLHVDHDHETKLVRGLLCNDCNRGLGCFKDNATALQKAVDYLRSV